MQLGDVTLAQKIFGDNHAASVKARETNGWKPTLANPLKDVQKGLRRAQAQRAPELDRLQCEKRSMH